MKRITIQDGRTTHVVVYVNWKDEVVISEAEYEAKLEEETKIAAEDYYDFSHWLYENYTTADIWNMNKEEKEEVKDQWLKYCRECMKEELCYERRVLI